MDLRRNGTTELRWKRFAPVLDPSYRCLHEILRHLSFERDDAVVVRAQEIACGQISVLLLASYNAFHEPSIHYCGVQRIQRHPQASEKLLIYLLMTTSVPHAGSCFPPWARILLHVYAADTILSTTIPGGSCCPQ